MSAEGKEAHIWRTRRDGSPSEEDRERRGGKFCLGVGVGKQEVMGGDDRGQRRPGTRSATCLRAERTLWVHLGAS